MNYPKLGFFLFGFNIPFYFNTTTFYVFAFGFQAVSDSESKESQYAGDEYDEESLG